MSEKRFRVRFEQEDGRGEIVNEKGVELTAREVVDLLNYQDRLIEEQHDEIINWTKKYVGIKKENDKNNEYYRNRINDLEMMLRLREDELQVRQKIIAEAEDKRLKRS